MIMKMVVVVVTGGIGREKGDAVCGTVCWRSTFAGWWWWYCTSTLSPDGLRVSSPNGAHRLHTGHPQRHRSSPIRSIYMAHRGPKLSAVSQVRITTTTTMIIIILLDSRETTYLFQQLSVALQKGNAVSFQNTFTAKPVANQLFTFS